MLTLTRRAGESIQIGTQIVLTVARIGGGKVRIRITAPRDVNILRSELQKQQFMTAVGGQQHARTRT